MTYRELLEELKTVSAEQLDQQVAVHLIERDEYYPVQAVCVTVEDECDVLDQGHLILASPYRSEGRK